MSPKTSTKRIFLLVCVGLAFVAAVVLYIIRATQLAGALRAAAEGALIKHDLADLKARHGNVAAGANASSVRVEALNIMIAAKEREAVERPMKLKGADDAAVEAALIERGMLKPPSFPPS